MLTLLHDIPSAAALVAVLRLHALAEQGVAVAFVGLDLRGFDVSLPATLDVLEDFDRNADAARSLGIEVARPRRVPPTVAAHAVQAVAERHGRGAAWRLAVYRHHWAAGGDVADADQLVALAATIGLPSDEVAVAATSRRVHAALRRDWQTWRARGVGGVPVLVADGGTLLSADQCDADLLALASL